MIDYSFLLNCGILFISNKFHDFNVEIIFFQNLNIGKQSLSGPIQKQSHI